VTHLRVDIYPDGGFARLRANGELTAAGYDATLRRWLDTLPPLTCGRFSPMLVWTLRWWPRRYGRENGRWAGRARCWPRSHHADLGRGG
jgi:hypothetical protein